MTTTQQTTPSTDANSVRKVVNVKVAPAVAWRVFTEKQGTWWPLATYKIGKANAVDAVIEPRVGGRWYERGDDGSTCDWGRVLAWEPPSRLVLSWEISADWQPDASVRTEVEVRFIAEGPSTTRVELVHGKLERLAHATQLAESVGGGGGWNGLLRRFADTAEGREPTPLG